MAKQISKDLPVMEQLSWMSPKIKRGILVETKQNEHTGVFYMWDKSQNFKRPFRSNIIENNTESEFYMDRQGPFYDLHIHRLNYELTPEDIINFKEMHRKATDEAKKNNRSRIIPPEIS